MTPSAQPAYHGPGGPVDVLEQLAGRQMLVVTGKGGVGKILGKRLDEAEASH